jgi:hypothetical protein
MKIGKIAAPAESKPRFLDFSEHAGRSLNWRAKSPPFAGHCVEHVYSQPQRGKPFSGKVNLSCG